MVAAAEHVAEHSHAAGQADPAEERRPADEEKSQDASKRPETHVLIAKNIQVSASIIATIRVVHSSHPAQRAERLRDNGSVSGQIELVPIHDLRRTTIWLRVKVDFVGISDRKAKSADFTKRFTGSLGNGTIKFQLGHHFAPIVEVNDHPCRAVVRNTTAPHHARQEDQIGVTRMASAS